MAARVAAWRTARAGTAAAAKSSRSAVAACPNARAPQRLRGTVQARRVALFFSFDTSTPDGALSIERTKSGSNANAVTVDTAISLRALNLAAPGVLRRRVSAAPNAQPMTWRTRRRGAARQLPAAAALADGLRPLDVHHAARQNEQAPRAGRRARWRPPGPRGTAGRARRARLIRRSDELGDPGARARASGPVGATCASNPRGSRVMGSRVEPQTSLRARD